MIHFWLHSLIYASTQIHKDTCPCVKDSILNWDNNLVRRQLFRRYSCVHPSPSPINPLLHGKTQSHTRASIHPKIPPLKIPPTTLNPPASFFVTKITQCGSRCCGKMSKTPPDRSIHHAQCLLSPCLVAPPWRPSLERGAEMPWKPKYLSVDG